MKRLRYLLPVLLQLSTLLSMGQKNMDSLQNIVREGKRDMAEARALNTLASELARTDVTRAKEYLYQSTSLCNSVNLPIQLSDAYAQLVSLTRDLGELDSAAYYLALLKKLSEARPVVRSNYVGAAGLHYKQLGKIKEALPFMLESLDLATAATRADSSMVKRTAVAGQTLNVGNTYVLLGEYRTALHYHLQALTLFEAVGNKRGISFCYQMIGAGFLSLRELKPATLYTQRSLALKTELNDERGIATSLHQMGSIYSYAHQSDSALIYYDKALKINQKLGLKVEELNMDLDIGNVYSDTKDLNNARLFLQNGKTLATQIGDSTRAATFDAALISLQSAENKQEATEKKLVQSLDNSIETGDKGTELLNYKYLASYYATVGNLKKAVRYTEKYYEMTDSLENINAQMQLKRLEGQYNVEKKEKEIALLKKDQELTHLSLEKQKAFQYGAFIVVLLLLLIGFLLINRYRLANKARRVIEMEKMRNHIARDLHDDIGSTLTSINIMSNVALHTPEKQELAMRASLQKIKDRSSAIMEKMDDIVWTINPQNDTMEQLLYRMREFAAEILEPMNIQYSFEDKGDLSSLRLDVQKRKDLYLLFKEAVNNAAKYSQCKNLAIRLWQDRDILKLEIADDGKGFVEETLKGGNGLKNMRERAASMVARLRIDSVIGQGTRIGLDLPVT